MKNPRDIVKWPMVTEKTYSLAGQNKYTFIVEPAANKVEIKKAVEELFKVQVIKINTMNVKGKPCRVRNIAGYKPDRKKAIVTLKQGDKIEIF
ncbi:MAG TPA: 50S ribosomal protein L23 [Desulfotomaculum sp.]|jgi:large subunit ribosomal protein L23|nr:50S ribosomal protein L23 [Desulfotomaculum sp.]